MHGIYHLYNCWYQMLSGTVMNSHEHTRYFNIKGNKFEIYIIPIHYYVSIFAKTGMIDPIQNKIDLTMKSSSLWHLHINTKTMTNLKLCRLVKKISNCALARTCQNLHLKIKKPNFSMYVTVTFPSTKMKNNPYYSSCIWICEINIFCLSTKTVSVFETNKEHQDPEGRR